MNRVCAAVVSAFLLAAAAGCGGAGQTAVLGSRLAPGGAIADAGLEYVFRPYKGRGTVKDLFNHLYFQGDTVCFSVMLPSAADSSRTLVSFVNPADGASFEAERVEVRGKRVYGFSLVGSIMEDFFSGALGRPLPEGAYCCVPVPFEIVIMSGDGAGRVERRLRGSFIIRYEK
jgi:hypothetical protein